MNKFVKKRILLLFLTGELIVIGILFITIYRNQTKIYSPPPAETKLNAPKVKKEWALYIKQVGSRKAYSDFKKVYSHSIQFIQHPAMHIMGSLLYEANGLEGIVICDDSFAFGCYHGFLARAVQEKGLSNLQKLDALCVQHFGIYYAGCQHGIGHGILEYLGTTKLSEALHECDKFPEQDPIGGCKGGIYMEYNFTNLTHATNFKARQFKNSSPYAPCSNIEGKYQYSCYYSQPDWWNSALHGDYEKIGQLCEQLSGRNRDICYLGTGNIAFRSSNFTIPKTVDKCKKMASEYGTLLCDAGAEWTYKLYANQLKLDLSKSNLFCDHTTNKKLCIEKSIISG